MKKIFNYIFVDGFRGMALGLFATLVLGTIMEQMGSLFPDPYKDLILAFAKFAKIMMGAGIGVGVAVKLKGSTLVTISAALAGTIGAYGDLLSNQSQQMITDTGILFHGSGRPLGAFIGAITAVILGNFLTSKLKESKLGLEILIVPLFSVIAGCTIGIAIGDDITRLMAWIGSFINWAIGKQPFLMGVVVSVIMGMSITLPIGAVALALSLNLTGLAAGAATVGCCCNMIGFAIVSQKENGIGGFLAQGFGTSMLQLANIMKKPIIWLPSIMASAILGPVSTMVFKMTNTTMGCGMGSTGLVGVLTTYQHMSLTEDGMLVVLKIAMMYFVLPGAISMFVNKYMRDHAFVKADDVKLNL